jgi:hypothetical protein
MAVLDRRLDGGIVPQDARLHRCLVGPWR